MNNVLDWLRIVEMWWRCVWKISSNIFPSFSRNRFSKPHFEWCRLENEISIGRAVYFNAIQMTWLWYWRNGLPTKADGVLRWKADWRALLNWMRFVVDVRSIGYVGLQFNQITNMRHCSVNKFPVVENRRHAVLSPNRYSVKDEIQNRARNDWNNIITCRMESAPLSTIWISYAIRVDIQYCSSWNSRNSSQAFEWTISWLWSRNLLFYPSTVAITSNPSIKKGESANAYHERIKLCVPSSHRNINNSFSPQSPFPPVQHTNAPTLPSECHANNFVHSLYVSCFGIPTETKKKILIKIVPKPKFIILNLIQTTI